MNYLTCKQIAQIWDCTPRRVQELCKKGAILGAVRHGREWLIPPNTPKPADGRKTDNQPTACNTFAMYMESYLNYNCAGRLDALLNELDNSSAHDLFRAQIHVYRGQAEQALALLNTHQHDHLPTSLRGLLANILAQCAAITGDIQLWQSADRYIAQTPCAHTQDRVLLDFWQAANACIISDYSHFSPLFRRGDFSQLPVNLYPIARFFYAHYLYLQAHQTVVEAISGRVSMLFVQLLPFTIEPLISQTHIEGALLSELHLRLLCAVNYHTSGQDALAALQLKQVLALALPDRLYLPLAQYRQQLGSLLDEALAQQDTEALAQIKRLDKTSRQGWVTVHNYALKRNVVASLSNRERQIASLAVYGLSNKEIADRLSITVDAVKQTLRNTMNKTGAQNRKELYRYV